MEAVARGAQDYLCKDRLDGYVINRCLNHAVERHRVLEAIRKAERTARRMTRAWRVLSKCNEVLVRAEDEIAYLKDTCRIVVQNGEYRMAWVGYGLHDAAKTVQVVARAGAEEGYFDAVTITWSDAETGRGPTGTAMRTMTPVINRNTSTNPAFSPWRSEALARGYAASVAVPLITDAGVLGALTIYAAEPDAFDTEEVELLTRLADDVSFGIATIRNRAAKGLAERNLRDAQHQLDLALNGAEDFIFIKDRNLRFVQVNASLATASGLEPSQFIGRTAEELGGSVVGTYSKDMELRAVAGQSIESELAVPIKGISVILSFRITPLTDADGNITGIFGIARDVTDRKPRNLESTQRPEEYPSKAMQSTLSLARRTAQRASTVLLLGESGSGKDHLAKYIHHHSDNSHGPYLGLNCAAISESLAESELFGHEKGAFTGAVGRKRGMLELAEGGTLLLNEIGELPLPLQAKLLTFLDTKRFVRVGGEKEITASVRLIAATNRDLMAEVQNGRFRQDLYYRLNVVTIEVPPLRKRLEDIPILVKELLSQICREMQFHGEPTVSASTLRALTSYHWPGNVRELRNVLERALILADGQELSLAGLGVHWADDSSCADRNQSSAGSRSATGGLLNTAGDHVSELRYQPGRLLQDVTDEITKAFCTEALRFANGNKKQAARALGISRDSLYRHMKKFGI